MRNRFGKYVHLQYIYLPCKTHGLGEQALGVWQTWFCERRSDVGVWPVGDMEGFVRYGICKYHMYGVFSL